MPVYNGANFLPQTLNSVLEQTFNNWELIIINDASTDNSPLIINDFKRDDKRISLLENNRRLGVAASLNKALQTAKGKFIARIDADDTWDKTKLEKQLAYLEKYPDIDLLATQFVFLDEIKKKRIHKSQHNSEYEVNANSLVKKNFICHSSILVKAEVINELGGYNEKYKNSEDYDLWLRLLTRYNATILNEPLVKYRIHPNMASLKRRRQQAYYSIKARNYAIFNLNYPKKALIYHFPDIWKLMVPDFVIHLKKRLSKFLNL